MSNSNERGSSNGKLLDWLHRFRRTQIKGNMPSSLKFRSLRQTIFCQSKWFVGNFRLHFPSLFTITLKTSTIIQWNSSTASAFPDCRRMNYDWKRTRSSCYWEIWTSSEDCATARDSSSTKWETTLSTASSPEIQAVYTADNMFSSRAYLSHHQRVICRWKWRVDSFRSRYPLQWHSSATLRWTDGNRPLGFSFLETIFFLHKKTAT